MTTQTVEKELLDLEKKYWRAIQEEDVDTALRLTADPCIVAGATGVARLDKRTLADMMKSAPYKLERFELKDPKAMLVGDDVAILAYKVQEKLTVDGKPVTVNAADTSTWVRRDGRWECALHTEAIEGDPYGRDRGFLK